jgi:hypothetical protein
VKVCPLAGLDHRLERLPGGVRTLESAALSRRTPLADLCSFLSRNEFRLRKPNEQLRNFISGHGFAE